MSLLDKIENVVFGLIMVYFGVSLLFSPEDYFVIVLILFAMMAWKGIKTLFFYFSMAKYMVGGQLMLFKGVMYVDVALFTLSFVFSKGGSSIYILLYLIAYYAFTGVVDVLRAFEAKGGGARDWGLKFGLGMLSIIVSITCIVFFNNMNVAVMVYSVGLIISALFKIFGIFKKTEIVYIS